MDGIANIAKTQQSQITPQMANGVAHSNQRVETAEATRLNNEKNKEQDLPRIDSKESMDRLIEELNDALSPFNTSLRFGVDKQDIFYVSIIDSKNDRMIRRYPAEEALDLLPKMKDVGGAIFDSKG